MPNKLTTITPSGNVTTLELDRLPTLEEMQRAVGGYIETVPYFDRFDGKPCVAFCNEEGKLQGEPINDRATGLWVTCLQSRNMVPHDILVGAVAIVTGDDLANL
jgi:hypothetical protein